MASDSSNGTAWMEEVLRRYERPLLRHALKITGDFELARDVVQDTFLKLVKADRTQVIDHLAAWLFTVCRNRALDISKKERRMGHSVDEMAIADNRAGPNDKAANSEALGLVFEVLDTLSDRHKEAFRLKFEDDLTYREISQVMGVSLGTVNRLITAALVAVRGRLMFSEPAVEERLR